MAFSFGEGRGGAFFNHICVNTAVVILNYNGRHFLERFLPLVVRHTPHAEIIVADNCSTDGSVAWLRGNFPDVRIIENPDNGGFSRGYNLALSQVDAEYYVLLNSDVEVTPQWLEPMLKLMEKNPRIAACHPKIKSFHNRTHFEHAGAAGGYIDRWGYPFCRGRMFHETETDQGQYNDSRAVFWATGTCMVIRRAAYWQVGGLDNDFFAHMEEIDLCWRLQNHGYDIFCCAQSEVYHLGGGTLSTASPFKTYLNFRNGLAMLYKNLPASRLAGTIFIRLLLDGIAGMAFFLQGKPAHCWAVVRAHFSFYKRITFWMKQRKDTLRTNRNLSGVMYSGSIVCDFFLRSKKKFSELRF